MKQLGVSILKALLLLLSIPVLYQAAFRVARLFHTPGAERGNVNFGLTLFLLQTLSLLCLPAIVLIHDFWIRREITSTLIHTLWFIGICLLTASALSYKPYEFGLLLGCIGSTILTRVVLDRVLRSR